MICKKTEMYTVDTLCPAERMLAKKETVKVQARARIEYRQAIGLDHNLGKCQM